MSTGSFLLNLMRKKKNPKRFRAEDLIQERQQAVSEEEDMTEMARKELIARIRGLDEEEMILVAQTLPVEVCLDRIRDELKAAEVFQRTISNCCNQLDSVRGN